MGPGGKKLERAVGLRRKNLEGAVGPGGRKLEGAVGLRVKKLKEQWPLEERN